MTRRWILLDRARAVPPPPPPPLHKPLQGHPGLISPWAQGAAAVAVHTARPHRQAWTGRCACGKRETGAPPPWGHRWRRAGRSSAWPSARTGAPWPAPAGRGGWCCGTSRISSPGCARARPVWAAGRRAAWPSARTGAPWPAPATTAPSGRACGSWRRPAGSVVEPGATGDRRPRRQDLVAGLQPGRRVAGLRGPGRDGAPVGHVQRAVDRPAVDGPHQRRDRRGLQPGRRPPGRPPGPTRPCACGTWWNARPSRWGP